MSQRDISHNPAGRVITRASWWKRDTETSDENGRFGGRCRPVGDVSAFGRETRTEKDGAAQVVAENGLRMKKTEAVCLGFVR